MIPVPSMVSRLAHLRYGRAAILLSAVLAASPAAATTSEDVARAAQGLADARRGIAEAGTDGPEGVLALGRAVAAYEAALGSLRDVVIGAGDEERRLALDLAARREEVERLLAALQAIARNPPPAVALHPQGPEGAARAAGVMARITPALQAEADETARRLTDLEAARALHRKALEALAAGLDDLEAAQAKLSATMAAEPVIEPDGEAPNVDAAMALVLRDSMTLTALAAALAAAPGRPEVEMRAESLSWPVNGTIQLGYKEPDSAGVRRPGLVLAAPPLSVVSAPVDAMVRYAGPFLDYGFVTVLEADDSALVLLAGMAQLAVRTGRAVRRGDPIGLLGGRMPDAEEYVMAPGGETDAGLNESLYIEIRHGREPVDPVSLFAGRNG
jgi:septal ring factor EnvC (AmiA/AmiB activator)